MSQSPPQEPFRKALEPGPANVLPVLGYSAPKKAGIELKRVALQQRAINLCILAYIMLFIADIGAASAHIALLFLVLPFAIFAVMITGAVFAFMLAISLYNVGIGIVLGLLTLVPVLGLIILLVVNSRATRVLRDHGIRVGLLGADPSTIPIDGGP